MRTSLSLIVPTLLVLAVGTTFVAGQNDDDANGTIVDVAVAAGSFKTLAAALQAADLVETLQGDGPFTVFAPTDEAFAKLPKGTVEALLQPENRGRLIRVLTYHVVPGRFMARQALGTPKTVEGSTVKVDIVNGQLKVNDARVVTNDIVASNGLIHVIDQVLLPADPAPASPREAATRLILLAIEHGVPIYNNHQPAACGAIYEVALQAIVDRPQGLPKTTVARFSRALAEARRTRDVVDSAWILRRAMDAGLEELMTDSSKTGTSRSDRDDDFRTVFDFEGDAASDSWFTLNDDVMGGISRCGFRLTDRGTALFRGALSLENNGGFATIRSRAQDLELAGYDGLVMRVRGDGRVYGVSAMPSDRRREVNTWRQRFETRAGEWQEIRVPFGELVHSVMGRQFPQSGPLPAERIRAISFTISDKNETPFELEIDWIKAYREGVSF